MVSTSLLFKIKICNIPTRVAKTKIHGSRHIKNFQNDVYTTTLVFKKSKISISQQIFLREKYISRISMINILNWQNVGQHNTISHVLFKALHAFIFFFFFLTYNFWRCLWKDNLNSLLGWNVLPSWMKCNACSRMEIQLGSRKNRTIFRLQLHLPSSTEQIGASYSRHQCPIKEAIMSFQTAVKSFHPATKNPPWKVQASRKCLEFLKFKRASVYLPFMNL